MAGRIGMGEQREITAAVVDRYRSAGRADKGRILDELCAVTSLHRKQAVRALATKVSISAEARPPAFCEVEMVAHGGTSKKAAKAYREQADTGAKSSRQCPKCEIFFWRQTE